MRSGVAYRRKQQQGGEGSYPSHNGSIVHIWILAKVVITTRAIRPDKSNRGINFRL